MYYLLPLVILCFPAKVNSEGTEEENENGNLLNSVNNKIFQRISNMKIVKPPRNKRTGRSKNLVQIGGCYIHFHLFSVYIGCYLDKPKRQLAKGSTGEDMTPEKCGERCKNHNYFGLQVSNANWMLKISITKICFRYIQKPHICFCGAKLQHSEVRPESDCNHKCPGDETQKCGGGWRNSLYKWFNERSTQGDLGKTIKASTWQSILRLTETMFFQEEHPGLEVWRSVLQDAWWRENADFSMLKGTVLRCFFIPFVAFSHEAFSRSGH